MSDMTTAEAAERLRVSQRQVQRLIRTGEVPARRTAGDAWVLDALAVNALARSRPSRGRPWSTEAAWGALWMLSGLGVSWVDDRTRSRLSSRLKAMKGEDLVHATRRRAEVRRCRVSESFLDELAGHLALSGASAAEQFGLAGEASRVEGYCDEKAWAAIRSQFRLVDDARGNATIRVTTFPDVLRGGPEAMPRAVVAVDLAESHEVRERATGLRVLEELLGE
jgi:excisionase family DNA binding protein